MIGGDRRRHGFHLYRQLSRQLIVELLLIVLLTGCSSMLRWNDTGQHGYRHQRAAASASNNGGSAVVRKGDTLYSIAFRNNLDYHDLAAWNGIDSNYTIYPGQRLRLHAPRHASHQRRAAAAPQPVKQAAPVVSSRPSPMISPMIPAPAPATPVDTVPPAGSQTFSSARWQWPVSGGNVVQRFDPDHGSKGINIAGRLGQTVVAAAPGKVVYSGSALKGYGKLLIIKHDERYLSAYGYNQKLLVQEGQWVRAGQAIAEMGEGPERRDELHFEIRDRGRPIDPLSLLPRP